jgi:hypothetical protein
MLNIGDATPSISHEFGLASSRAMQCPAYDPQTGEWYVSQAENFGALENMQITRNGAAGPKHKRISTMRLVRGGHGSTITVLYRDGVLGIVTNAWGGLRWIRYRAGDVKKDDVDVTPIWSGSYAHVDHETSTVCIRSGSSFRLYELNGDVRGSQIGKTVTGLSSSGPGQGFCSGKIDGEFYIFTMWDYGRPTSKPTVVWGSVATGQRIGSRSARLFPKAKRNEPESGIVLNGVFHLGMSMVDGHGKHGILAALNVPIPPVPVTMWIRPLGDPIWKAPPFEVTARDRKGVFTKTIKPAGAQVVGVGVQLIGDAFFKVGPDEFYRLSYLTAVDPAPVQPVPEVPKP